MSTSGAVSYGGSYRPATRRLRVLHVGKYYPPYRGGIETHLQILCGGLRDDVDVSVLVANDSKENRQETVERIEVDRVATRFHLAGAPVCPGMVERIRASDADIIHLHLPNPSAVLAYFASGHRGKVIASYHSDVVRQKILGRAFEPILHRLLRRSSAVIAASPQQIENSSVLRRYEDRCHVIPYGIPLEPYRNVDEAEVRRIREEYGPRLVVSVGRLVYYKGFEHLIEAMARVDAKLLLIGEGPLRSNLQQQVARLGLLDRVIFAGQVPDPTPYYCAADVFVLPSIVRSEAFGIVQLEAMACGTPVINTQLPSGVPFVSKHEVTGLTVQPRDADGLVGAIDRLITDSGYAQRLGSAARLRVNEEFGQATMVRRTLELYEEVVGIQASRDD